MSRAMRNDRVRRAGSSTRSESSTRTRHRARRPPHLGDRIPAHVGSGWLPSSSERVFVSASTSRPLPAEIAESAHLVALIERGRAQGHIAADEVRQAFEEADIPMAKAKSVMRALTTVLHEEGVDLTVNATQSAGVARKRVAAAAKTAAKKTATATTGGTATKTAPA